MVLCKHSRTTAPFGMGSPAWPATPSRRCWRVRTSSRSSRNKPPSPAVRSLALSLWRPACWRVGRPQSTSRVRIRPLTRSRRIQLPAAESMGRPPAARTRLRQSRPAAVGSATPAVRRRLSVPGAAVWHPAPAPAAGGQDVWIRRKQREQATEEEWRNGNCAAGGWRWLGRRCSVGPRVQWWRWSPWW